MAMGFFQKIWAMMKGKANDAVDKSIDPATIMRQGLREADKEIKELESSLTEVVTDRNEINKELKSAQSEVNEWQKAAEHALDKGMEDEARKALGRVERAEERVSHLSQTASSLEHNIEVIKQKLQALKDQKQRAKTDVSSVSARSKAAQASITAQELANRSGDSQMGEMMGLAEEHLSQAESRADALSELNGGAEEDLKSKIYGNDKQSVEERLAKMKAARG